MTLVTDRLLTVLRSPEFWYSYVFDDDSVDLEEVGERFYEEFDEVVLDLPAGEEYALRLYLDFETGGLHHLFLVWFDDDGETHEDETPEEATQRRQEYESERELGHWDEARWHPFCLRWDEVEAVVARGAARPERQEIPPEVARLLLARWVGHGGQDTEALQARRQVIAADLARIVGYAPAEAERMAALVLPSLSEEDQDYAWRWDDERGWTFSGSYSCYSNRNAEHSFPFDYVRDFRAFLGVGHDEPALIDPDDDTEDADPDNTEGSGLASAST